MYDIEGSDIIEPVHHNPQQSRQSSRDQRRIREPGAEATEEDGSHVSIDLFVYLENYNAKLEEDEPS